MARATLGAEAFADIQESIGLYNSAAHVQRLIAAGVPTVPAAVRSLTDTGSLVNYDPVVDLVVQPAGSAEPVTLRAVVSKLAIPRVGDQVLLLSGPGQPGGYSYAGLAQP